MEVLKYRVDGTSEWKDIIGLQGKRGEPGPVGPMGPQGEPGEDGKTPIKGEDYWTNEDKKEIESYIDDKLGVIENAYY